MSKLGWVTIRGFLGPFILNFVVWMLLLDMQSLWLYIDDLMGKGLPWTVVLELMFYFSANWVPVALPLSVLLASIMTMGRLGENNELTAMKAAGLSLWKIMRPLMMLMVFVSCFAFYFSNSLWPMAYFKMRVLLQDIQQTNAAIIFKEGQFYNDIEGVSIRVGEKLPDGKSFKDILIYDLSEKKKNIHVKDYRDFKRVISAKKGSISQSTSNDYLLLTLHEGCIYQEMSTTDLKDTKTPYMRYYFDKADMKYEIQPMEFERSSVDDFQQEDFLLTLRQIRKRRAQVDSAYTVLSDKWILNNNGRFLPTRNSNDTSILSISDYQPSVSYFEKLSDSDKKLNILDAISKLQPLQHTNEISNVPHEIKYREQVNSLSVGWHQKFTLSFAVLMLFLLGGSLGAVIKKGGFGVPVLVAVVLFLFYFILTRGGQEMASGMNLTPLLGMWLSALVLTPVALFIFFKANADSPLFSWDFYIKIFKKKK